MGLDMYALTTTEKPTSVVDFDTDSHSELHYWRKHPNLHGWSLRAIFPISGETGS
jgi:hypothetical protein